MAVGGERLTLRDGSAILVRPIRPTDKAALLAAFERLGPESRYRRFLAPMPRLSAAMLRYLTEVDHHDHEALAAFDLATGDGVGVARFIREAEHPQRAEAAVTVADDWQGRGLGTLLLERLAERAHDEGISEFSAFMLASNDEMRDLLDRVGDVETVDRNAGVVEVVTRIVDRETLRELLRAGRAETGPTPVAGPRHTRS